MNYNFKEAEFEIERLQSRVNHLTVTNHNVRQKNKELAEAMLAMRHELKARAEMDGNGVYIVGCSQSVWEKFNKALDEAL